MFARFLFFSFLISAAALAAEPFSEQQTLSVSQSIYWKKLLHYRSGRSEADGPGFFLSPKGKINLQAELLANIAAFQNPEAAPVGPLKQHPQCAFPERYRFLKKELQLQIKDQDCPEFLKWKNQLRPRSVVLVYAAAYMGSPASMFGHTFLRIDSEPRPGHREKNDLLDYAVSFEAIVEPNPGPAYVLKGLLGFYPGYFSINPYYLKINNYTNMDSRDLWEYQLNLNSDQIDRLINHLWETGTTYFNYYFFDRNCAYHILSLLEVANPDWDLRNQFHLYAIPIDTVRTLTNKPDSIKDIQVRPSILRTLEGRLSRMTSSEQDRFYILKNNISLINENDSAKVLDAVMDWQKFVSLSKIQTVDQAQLQIDRNLLLLRAQKTEFDNFTLEKMIPPHEGHRSGKISLLTGTEGSDHFVGFEARPAFHDLLGPDLGYLPQSELIIGKLRASTLFGKKTITRIDDLTLASVTNFEPFTRLQKKFSWTVGGGATRPMDLDCTDCLAASLNGGMGSTVEIQKSNWTLLVTGHAESSDAFVETMGRNYRVAPGVLFSVLIPFSERWKFYAFQERLRYFAGGAQADFVKSEVSISYFLKSVDLRAQWSSARTNYRSVEITTLNAGWYF